MSRLARFIAGHMNVALCFVIAIAIGASYVAVEMSRVLREQEHLGLLAAKAERFGDEIVSRTLSGNLMGAVAALGQVDTGIIREVQGDLPVNSPGVLDVLERIGIAHGIEGVFVVAGNGVIGSSWDTSGKRSTGLDVAIRPYFRMSMQGLESVYAAVSIARGDRSLYIAAPVFTYEKGAPYPIGAVVGRTNLRQVDTLLGDTFDVGLLLSPQGVVFASTNKDWIGSLAGPATPERITAIRNLKQFGNMFESREPGLLPISVEPGLRTFSDKRHAVSAVRVPWNDPYGDWKLVLIEDLSRSIPFGETFRTGLTTGCVLLLVCALTLNLLNGYHKRAVAVLELEAYLKSQQAEAERKGRIASTALSLQHAKNQQELAQFFLSKAFLSLKAMQGVVYFVDGHDSGVLRRASSFACAEEPPEVLAFGEGLLGQCALDRRVQVVEMAEDGFTMIRSGLGEIRPAAVVLGPVRLGDDVLGAVEIAVLGLPSEQDLQQFAEMTRLLAMNVAILGRGDQERALLSVTLSAERVQAEQLLFQQVLLDTIPYPVFYKDAESRFLGFNKAYEDAFGVRREDLVGKRVLDLEYLPLADRVAYQAEDEATIASVGTVRREMAIPYADGILRQTLYFVSGFRRPDGSPGGLVGTFIDLGHVAVTVLQTETAPPVQLSPEVQS